MDQPVKTFSIGFLEDSYSELKFARLAAKRFGTDHHEFFVTPEICNIVDDLAWHFDEPFADSSAIPTYIVSKLARYRGPFRGRRRRTLCGLYTLRNGATAPQIWFAAEKIPAGLDGAHQPKPATRSLGPQFHS